MIHPDSRTIEWVREVAKENKMSDLALVEKTIRAFSLLEAFVRSGCPFVFKGGTSLMLHLDSAKRISIDIDIICPPNTQIEDCLDKYAAEYGFGEIQLVERISRTDVISAPLNTKLNKLKKSDIEAFFYWNEIQKLLANE